MADRLSSPGQDADDGRSPTPDPRRRARRRRTLMTLGVLLPVVIYVVYSSFHAADVACEVCIAFEGRDACRTVASKTAEESTRGAITNTCALLASGVTDTLRCERTKPRKVECR
jgi:hypothetical protein